MILFISSDFSISIVELIIAILVFIPIAYLIYRFVRGA